MSCEYGVLVTAEKPQSHSSSPPLARLCAQITDYLYYRRRRAAQCWRRPHIPPNAKICAASKACAIGPLPVFSGGSCRVHPTLYTLRSSDTSYLQARTKTRAAAAAG